MAEIHLVRQNRVADADVFLQNLVQLADGEAESDRRSIRRLLKKIYDAQPGEVFIIDHRFSRSTPFHRRCMAIEGAVYASQEQFTDREMFRNWLKLNIGWVRYVPAVSGYGISALPKSISFAKADEQQFREYWDKVESFLRSDRCSNYLWPHLTPEQGLEMIEAIFEEFDDRPYFV